MEAPEFLEQNYQFKPIAGKVIVDLCWHTFCQICDIGAQRVQKVCKEFGEALVLQEYRADNHEIFSRYQTPRGIFENEGGDLFNLHQKLALITFVEKVREVYEALNPKYQIANKFQIRNPRLWDLVLVIWSLTKSMRRQW